VVSGLLHQGEEQGLRGRSERPVTRGRRWYKREPETTAEPRTEAHGASTAGYRVYTVKEGDGISSIAFQFGLPPDSVWNDPKNRDLKERRKDPNVLSPGDVVYVRDKELKEVEGATEQRHRFRRKGIPEVLRLRFVDEDGEPRAHVPFVLEIDGTLLDGKTDADGVLVHQVPPNAKHGSLTLGSGAEQEVLELRLGHLDPVTEISGVQGRLNNLGYDCGDELGKPGEETRRAVCRFQADHGLPVTGEADDATCQALEREDRV
jgi:hypothetical protein